MCVVGRHLLRIGFYCILILHATSAFASATDDRDATLDPATVLQSQNRLNYQVVIGDEEKGSIDIFSYQRGTFVPAEALLQRLGYIYTRDDDKSAMFCRSIFRPYIPHITIQQTGIHYPWQYRAAGQR